MRILSLTFILLLSLALAGAAPQPSEESKSLADESQKPSALLNLIRADPKPARNTSEPDEDGDEEDPDDDDDDDDEESGEPSKSTAVQKSSGRLVSDVFGNQLRLLDGRTYLVSQNTRRDLGLIAFKAIVLGPLIGLTIKAALLRGLIWALGAYVVHLFFPSLLAALGLGSGLVGFARQMQPDYMAMLLPQLAHLPSNLHSSLPNSLAASLTRMASQYMRLFQPVVESIRSIPEGHCRFRAVCETAGYLVRNTQLVSQSLQRLSATVYLNFGTDYSKAWLDGVVQSDCAVKYAQCPTSPLSMVATKLAEAMRPTASSL